MLKRFGSTRVASAIAFAIAMLAAGCSDTNHAVTGRLTLTGNLWAADGTPAGTRVIADASGVRVYLERLGAATDSTLSSGGVYRLVGPQGSDYRVTARAGPKVLFASETFAIGKGDVFVSQPLALASTGNVSASPNPFTAGESIHFELLITDRLFLGTFSVAGLRVQDLGSGTWRSGIYDVPWDGLDRDGQTLPDGPYWVVLSTGGREEAELVFKGP
ncbi:MAG TPA: hypothetical protein VJY35_03930 [Candidatus Eisenbacteria bacterium]|nr:hypothetical protein [Candidatus Eisenbacteria bacterium]